jgi:hypothetical protein
MSLSSTEEALYNKFLLKYVKQLSCGNVMTLHNAYTYWK